MVVRRRRLDQVGFRAAVPGPKRVTIPRSCLFRPDRLFSNHTLRSLHPPPDSPFSRRGVAAVIHVDKLTKFFGDYAAIRDVSFDVPRGRVVGFLGPNGAGKTTTMRILAGFLTATSGTAPVAGLDVFWNSS